MAGILIVFTQMECNFIQIIAKNATIPIKQLTDFIFDLRGAFRKDRARLVYQMYTKN